MNAFVISLAGLFRCRFLITCQIIGIWCAIRSLCYIYTVVAAEHAALTRKEGTARHGMVVVMIEKRKQENKGPPLCKRNAECDIKQNHPRI